MSNYEKFKREFPIFLTQKGIQYNVYNENVMGILGGDFERIIAWETDINGIQYGKHVCMCPFDIPKSILRRNSDAEIIKYSEDEDKSVMSFLYISYAAQTMVEQFMPAMLTIPNSPPYSGFSQPSLDDDVLQANSETDARFTSTLLFIPEIFEYSYDALLDRLQAHDRIFTKFIELSKEVIDNSANSPLSTPVSSDNPVLSVMGQPLEEFFAVMDRVHDQVINSFNGMNNWLNERGELSQQYSGALWNSDGDEYFESLISYLDLLIKLLPKHLGNGLYGFIQNRFIFWKLQFNYHQGYRDSGQSPQNSIMNKYRQILSLPNSWYRLDFSEGEVKWQFPECIPEKVSTAPDYPNGVETYIDGVIKHAKDVGNKNVFQNATEDEMYDTVSKLIVAEIKSIAQQNNGILDVLIDDIYHDLKKRNDYHPNQLLKVCTYFRHDGLRSEHGFDIIPLALGNTAVLMPVDFEHVLASPNTLPPRLPLFKDSVRVSDVKALAKEIAQQFCQSGIPTEFDKKKAWKLNLQLPSTMPYDTMEQQWMDEFYLSEDGKVILGFQCAGFTLPIDGAWVEIDFVGLIEHLQWLPSFKWKQDTGGGEWAYPVAQEFISASEAAKSLMGVLNSLKEEVPKRKEAEEQRKAEEARKKAEEQRKAEEAHEKAEELRRQEEEQQKKEAQSQQWASQGLCRYCGGKLAMFGRKCKSCDRQN